MSFAHSAPATLSEISTLTPAAPKAATIASLPAVARSEHVRDGLVDRAPRRRREEIAVRGQRRARRRHVLVGLEQMSAELAAREGHPLLGPGSIHASIIDGGRELSTYPDSCRLQLERRTLPGETAESVEAELSAMLDAITDAGHDLSAELHTTLVRDPFEVDADSAIVTAAREALGGDVPVIGVPFWADSAIFSAAGIPTVIFGPGGEGAHADVEWVDLNQLDRCVDALDRVIASFCS